VVDDYLLPWLPWFAIFLLLLLYRPAMEPRWGPGWAVLVLFATYGIAATHDYYAASRARVQAAATLEATGVARRNIDGGFEFNGWTKLLEAGHICRSGARAPAGDPACVETFDPRYFLSFSPVPDLVSTPVPPLFFRVWLPPFQRQVLVLMKPSK
jgi:hypothetical protein